jgi:hypothetical protein
MIQFKKNMKFSYVFSILFLSINVFSIENYVAEYRWESSDRDILGVRKLVIEEMVPHHYLLKQINHL